MRDTHRERQRPRQREKQAPAGSLMQNSIPGPRDHNLSQRQTLNHWAAQVLLLCISNLREIYHLFNITNRKGQKSLNEVFRSCSNHNSNPKKDKVFEIQMSPTIRILGLWNLLSWRILGAKCWSSSDSPAKKKKDKGECQGPGNTLPRTKSSPLL